MLALIPIIGPGLAEICAITVLYSIYTGSYPQGTNILAFVSMVALYF